MTHEEPSPITDKTQAFDYINQWLQVKGRPFTYDYFLQELPLDGSMRIYGFTNVLPEELATDMQLRRAYTIIYADGLQKHNLIPPGKVALIVRDEDYTFGDEGYAFIRVDFIDASND